MHYAVTVFHLLAIRKQRFQQTTDRYNNLRIVGYLAAVQLSLVSLVLIDTIHVRIDAKLKIDLPRYDRPWAFKKRYIWNLFNVY